MTEVTTLHSINVPPVVDDSGVANSNRDNLPPIPADHHLVVERHYEAGPPEGMELVRAGDGGAGTDDEPGDTFAATKEEEWVTKKKTEVTTTRQIETRVKRQVVLEDGKVVEDSGPIVTTNTTEDTEKQEHEQTEHRTLGASEDAAPDTVDGILKVGAGGGSGGVNDNKQLTSNGEAGNSEWRVISVKDAPHLDGATVVKEVKEHRVLSREETEETRETEDVQHLGDITDEQYLNAIRSGNEDIRKALEQNKNSLIVSTGPRIVHQSIKTHKTVDTEDKEEKSAIQPDGRIITETKRTTEHDETKDEELTDENASDIDVVNESSQRHHKTKDQEHIDYIADGVPIGREMRYTAETAEGERYGDPGMEDPDWDSLSTRIRKSRRQQTSAAGRHQLFKQRGLDAPNSPVGAPLDRRDAITKRPIDFDQEEETRKEETSKWLEHHFGSDSRSSRDSLNEIEPATGPTTSYFNVTIKSKPTVAKQSNPPPPVTPKSYVTTPSPKTYTPTPEPINDAKYYQGVTDWSERRYEDHHQKSTSNRTLKDRQDTYRTKNHYGSADELERNSPKYYNGDSKRNGHESPYARGDPYSEEIPERDIHFKPIDDHTSYKIRDREDSRRYQDEPPTVPQRKRMIERKQRSSEDSHYDSGYRSHSRNEMSYLSRDSKEDLPLEEPPPDYSPPPRVTPSSSPSPPLHGVKDKKLYQRTRFAADIPPPTSSSSTSPHLKSKSPSGGNIIGQSIRKLVGKIRSASAERKAKQKAKRHMSRSPSPHQNSYQQFNVIDNNIPPPVGLVESSSHQRSSRHGEVGGAINDKQVSTALYQKQKSNLSSNNNNSKQNHISDQSMAENRKHVRNVSRGTTASPVQRYYLGEDPFGGSIYGRENKYDGVKPARSARKYNSSYHNNVKQENGYYRRESPSEDEISRLHSSTLGRLSKSTSRLAPHEDVIDYSRNVQTLPRNIHHYNNHSTSYKTNTLSHSPPTRLSKSKNNPSSTINVSIINTVSPPGSIVSTNRPLVNGGPAKPARTYKSTLSRSKSFNVHGGLNGPSPTHESGPTSLLNLQRNNMSTIYKSNPHMHRLDEHPTQLKSPGIVSSISRSQRDINEAIIEEDRKENTYTPNRFARNGYGDEKKKIFMKGLADTAPELFKTLHANEDRNFYKTSTAPKPYRTTSPKVTDNYRNNFVNTATIRTNTNDGYISPISKIESNYPGKHTTLRRGSSGSDNYSETYHITSKSDDPNHPSVTDTVKSFTKKTVPSKDGKRLETIESTETKTVTKSRYRGNEPNLKYIENGNKLGTSSQNGGVVIEVRNNNYRK